MLTTIKIFPAKNNEAFQGLTLLLLHCSLSLHIDTKTNKPNNNTALVYVPAQIIKINYMATKTIIFLLISPNSWLGLTYLLTTVQAVTITHQ